MEITHIAISCPNGCENFGGAIKSAGGINVIYHINSPKSVILRIVLTGFENLLHKKGVVSATPFIILN